MDNPYEPPRIPSLGPDRERAATPMPASVTVFGVLNLIYGGLGLICNPINGLINYNITPPAQAINNNPIMEIAASPTFRTGIVFFCILSTLACGVLAVSGIGLLARKAWGRSLALAYAIFELLAITCNFIFNLIFLSLPLVEIARKAPNPQASGNAIGGAIGGTAVVILWLIYPVFLLIFLSRPAVAEALRGPSRAGSDRDEFA